MILAIIVALFLFSPAQAQLHLHPPQDAELHAQFYSTWRMPNRGKERVQSCCNMVDCYPTDARLTNGIWYARRREDGAWIPVPAYKIEQNQSDPRESPDGRSHVCMPPPPRIGVFCFTLGSGI